MHKAGEMGNHLPRSLLFLLVFLLRHLANIAETSTPLRMQGVAAAAPFPVGLPNGGEDGGVAVSAHILADIATTMVEAIADQLIVSIGAGRVPHQAILSRRTNLPPSS